MDIDTPLLRDLKRLQKREKKSLGRIISDLLADALSRRTSGRATPPAFRWVSRPMRARVDLSDKEALTAVLDRDLPAR